MKEGQILVEKITSRQRLEKVGDPRWLHYLWQVRDKLRQEGEELREDQANMVKEKEKEGDELKASIAESNEESRANIQMKRRATQNTIKVTGHQTFPVL